MVRPLLYQMVSHKMLHKKCLYDVSTRVPKKSCQGIFTYFSFSFLFILNNYGHALFSEFYWAFDIFKAFAHNRIHPERCWWCSLLSKFYRFATIETIWLRNHALSPYIKFRNNKSYCPRNGGGQFSCLEMSSSWQQREVAKKFFFSSGLAIKALSPCELQKSYFS